MSSRKTTDRIGKPATGAYKHYTVYISSRILHFYNDVDIEFLSRNQNSHDIPVIYGKTGILHCYFVYNIVI